MNRQYGENLAFLNDNDFWTEICSDRDAVKQNAWDNLHRKSNDTFRAIAFRSTRDEHFAEDAVQELMVKLHKFCHRLLPLPNRMAYIIKILQRVLIDMAKVRGRIDRVFLSEVVAELTQDKKASQPDEESSQKEVRSQFMECLKSLSPEKQQAIRMFHFDEVGTIEECAEMLGISKDAFKSRVFYAKKELRDRFGREGLGLK